MAAISFSSPINPYGSQPAVEPKSETLKGIVFPQNESQHSVLNHTVCKDVYEVDCRTVSSKVQGFAINLTFGGGG